jgi:hypothetical protein
MAPRICLIVECDESGDVSLHETMAYTSHDPNPNPMS